MRKTALPLLRFVVAAIIAVAGLTSAVPARADLTIMPLRITFGDRDRSAEVNLGNSSNVTNTYRMEWLHNRATPEGTYERLEEPLDPRFNPEEHIVFSPRQVTITPGGQQRIRLSLRRPADLPAGEYRGHFLMRKVSDNSRTAPGRGPNENLSSLQVNVNLGFSVPVIVRVGPYDAQVKMSDIQLLPPPAPNAGPRMALKLNRTGKHSAVGRVLIFWTPPGGREEQIGVLNNVNVFHEVTQRHINVGLTVDRPLNAGTLRIVYEGTDSERGIKFDEQVLPIQ